MATATPRSPVMPEHAEIIARVGWDLDTIEQSVSTITGQSAGYRHLTPIMLDALIVVDSDDTRFILDGPHAFYSVHHKCGRCGSQADLDSRTLDHEVYVGVVSAHRSLNARRFAALRRLGRRIAGCDHKV